LSMSSCTARRVLRFSTPITGNPEVVLEMQPMELGGAFHDRVATATVRSQ
jgi:hypothetical protein